MPENLNAQHLVQGRVLDAETGDPLPAANVQIDQTFQGTITNIDGQFSLQVETLPAVLIFRYIGYASQQVDVTGDTSENLEVNLQPIVYSMGEVVVTEEDPAISIMERVIERKKIWREQLASYSAEAYNRFTLKNDTGIVSIMESFTDTYWNPEEGTREVVKARRQTSNMDIGDILPAARFVANLYDDNLDIAGYNFMGITHPDALKHYIFELQGYDQIDDQLVYEISVQPRNRLKTGFKGKVSVLDEEYALLEVELQPGEAFLFPPPIQEFNVTYFQQYSNFGGDFWLPVDFRSNMDVELGMNLLLKFPTIYVEQVSRISNYDVNAIIPDTLFAEGEDVVVDSVSVAEDKLLDTEGVAVPLDRAEASAYATIDSTMSIAKAYEPTGAFAKVLKVSARDEDSDDEVVLAGEDEGRRGRRSRRRQRDSSAVKLPDLNLDLHVRNNRVEGLYAELGTTQRITNAFRVRGGLGLGTAMPASDALSYRVGSTLYIDRAHRFSLDVDYAKYTDTQTPSTPALRTFDAIVVLLGGMDYYDYYRNERLNLRANARIPRLDTRVSFGVNLETHGGLDKQTDYDLLGEDYIQRPNPTIVPGEIRSFVVEAKIGDEDDAIGFTGRRLLSLGLEHASQDMLGSNYDFTIFKASLDWRFETFFTRRLLPNVLDLKIMGQLGSKDIVPQRMFALDGRMSIYNRFGTFKTLQDMPYRDEEGVGVFWEHNFRTVPFEMLGMRGVAEKAINVIVFGGHGRTWSKFPQDVMLRPNAPKWHHEAGVSLSGLFSIFRLDFAFRLDEPGFSVGLGTARIF